MYYHVWYSKTPHFVYRINLCFSCGYDSNFSRKLIQPAGVGKEGHLCLPCGMNWSLKSNSCLRQLSNYVPWLWRLAAGHLWRKSSFRFRITPYEIYGGQFGPNTGLFSESVSFQQPSVLIFILVLLDWKLTWLSWETLKEAIIFQI